MGVIYMLGVLLYVQSIVCAVPSTDSVDPAPQPNVGVQHCSDGLPPSTTPQDVRRQANTESQQRGREAKHATDAANRAEKRTRMQEQRSSVLGVPSYAGQYD
jgi:hypothetical protein